MGVARGFSEAHWVRRWIEVLAFVGIWVAAGELLHMGQFIYLLFGIPLTAAFQLLIRRKPIKDLWVRGGPNLSLRTVSLKLAVPLAIFPFYRLVVAIVKAQGIGLVLFLIAAIAGAGAASYALGRFERRTWIYLALCAPLALCAYFAGVFLVDLIKLLLRSDLAGATTLAHPTGVHPQSPLLSGIESFLIYVPVTFMMEEVAFRGALDSHVRNPGEGSGLATRAYGVASAIFVSLLWGLWHHPVIPGPIWELLPVQVFMGLVLSLFWRRSGNLMVPGFAHALNDSVRNALTGSVPWG
jgi:membrane protease YdiL (CAAX protease family)